MTARELAAKCLRLTNLTTKTTINPWITEMPNKGHGKFLLPSKKATE